LRDEIEKQIELKKWLKTKQIAIRRIYTKFDIYKKIKGGWNWKKISNL